MGRTAPPLSARTRMIGKAALLRIGGEVTVSNATLLRRELFDVLREKPRALVLHLGDVVFMDSAGVAVILEGMLEARRVGATLVFGCPSPAARRALDMIDLTHLVPVAETPEECGTLVPGLSAAALRAGDWDAADAAGASQAGAP